MSPEAFHRAARSLPAVTMSVQWGDHRVYKVGGKMFALTDAEGTTCSFKTTPIAFEVLTETGRAVRAPYSAQGGCWAFFDDLAGLDEAEVSDWLRTSHGLIAAKLTRKLRAELSL